MGSGAKAQRMAMGQLIAEEEGYLKGLIAEKERNDPSDTFLKQQEKIKSLQVVLDQQSNVSFVTPAATPVRRQPSYLMLGGVGILLLMMFRKKGKG